MEPSDELVAVMALAAHTTECSTPWGICSAHRGDHYDATIHAQLRAAFDAGLIVLSQQPGQKSGSTTMRLLSETAPSDESDAR